MILEGDDGSLVASDDEELVMSDTEMAADAGTVVSGEIVRYHLVILLMLVTFNCPVCCHHITFGMVSQVQARRQLQEQTPLTCLLRTTMMMMICLPSQRLQR